MKKEAVRLRKVIVEKINETAEADENDLSQILQNQKVTMEALFLLLGEVRD